LSGFGPGEGSGRLGARGKKVERQGTFRGSASWHARTPCRRLRSHGSADRRPVITDLRGPSRGRPELLG
jgi:hypothetical protein